MPKLTKEQTQELLSLYEDHGVSPKELNERFNLNNGASRIIKKHNITRNQSIKVAIIIQGIGYIRGTISICYRALSSQVIITQG